MAVEVKQRSDGATIGLSDLPEGCIANALSLTSPRDACRLSPVCSAFRFAALSDDVWERFLPADYRDILGRSTDGMELLRSSLNKKQLFLRLCDNPILIDGGTKSFSLDKSTGKKCYMLAAKDISIVWSDTPDYWQWIPLPESRFTSVAELLNVCWLEIRGTMKSRELSPGTTYAAYLVFTLKSGFRGFQYPHPPAEASVGIGGQEGQKHTVRLDPDGAERRRRQMLPRKGRRWINFFRPQVGRQQEATPADGDPPIQYPKQRSDGWIEVKLGEIYVSGREDMDLEMSCMEVKGNHWKSGLAVEGIEVRPNEAE